MILGVPVRAKPACHHREGSCYGGAPMRRTTSMPLLLIALAGGLAACDSEIGDSCSYDIDCSVMMDRNCDRSQPGGYCLIIGCDPDRCPSEAVCVEFTTPCPEGTSADTCAIIEPNRGRTYCLKRCSADKHCRGAYACVEPADLNATIIDIKPRSERICVPDI